MKRRFSLHALAVAATYTWLPSAEFTELLQPQPLVTRLSPLLSNEHPDPGKQEGAPDPLYAQAVAVVVINQKASIALVQRHLKLGYSRTAKIFESMEQAGLIGTDYVNGYRQIRTQ
jgi:DNA segregation ATPase FtsK/SpoIIIE-like protein